MSRFKPDDSYEENHFLYGKEVADIREKAKKGPNRAITRAVLDSQYRAHASQLGLDVDVLSEGPVNSDVVFVGEGPGESEVRAGRPFIGGAGKLLWDSVRKYGLNRTNVYVTNVSKRQISLSRKGNERHVVLRDELDKWIGLLQWELSQLPNVRTVFCLGNYALEALLNETGVTNWRGSIVERKLPNGKLGHIVIANNPAYAQRELKQEPIFLMDCNKLDLVYRGVYKPYRIDEIINPSYKDAMAFIKELQKSSLPVSLDVEHVSGETACYGLANDAHRAMCINLRDTKENRFTLSQEADIMQAIQRLCDSHKIICQNGSHEIYWCWLHDKIKIPVWADILLAHHLLYPQFPHSLQFMVAQYTTHPYYKEDGELWKESGDINIWWRYNCKDAALPIRIWQRIYKELCDRKLDKLFFNHVMRAQPHLAAATVHGVAVDLDIKKYLVDSCTEETAKMKAEFHRIVQELCYDNLYYPNPNSPTQLRELFFDRLQLKGKGLSTDKTNREHIMKNPITKPLEKEMLASLDAYIGEDKFLSTFVEARVSEDNRMRCDYKQFGVARAPGRLSSSALIDKTGMNMQNQPYRARAMYVADPGCVFGYFDLMQAEAQVVGHRANIPSWKHDFARALADKRAGKKEIFDCHRSLAAQMFKMKYAEVPIYDWLDENGLSEKDPKCNHSTLRPTKRYVSKRCRHGLNYRMERFRLAEVTGLPYYEASRAFALYHGITPELEKWWREEESNFRKYKTITNYIGRELRIIQRIDEDALKSIVAFYPQSTVGDKITETWYKAEEDDKWPDTMYARVCIDVHDNLVCVSTPKYLNTCLAVLKKHAESPLMIQDVYKHKPEPLVIGAELKASYPTVFDQKTEKFVEDKRGFHRWSHMKEVAL